tara:strand:+ start:3852 stop:5261 length:1410 start_codon:yes stop_codon:yes gene_type:complete
MAIDNLKYLRGISVSAALSNSQYILVSDILSGTNARLQLSQLNFPLSSGGGNSLIASNATASDPSITLKGVQSTGSNFSITSLGNILQFGIVESQIDLSNCKNTTSNFISNLNLSDITAYTGVLPTSAGGTGMNLGVSNGAIWITSGATGVGTLEVKYGGTGAVTHTDGGLLVGAGTSAITNLGIATNGQIPIGDGSGAPTLTTLTAGTGIDITNGAGSITVGLGAMTAALDLNNQNIKMGTGWVSNDGGNEGIKIDTDGKTFLGQAASTAVFTETLNIKGNVLFDGSGNSSLKVAAPVSGAGFNLSLWGGNAKTSGSVGGNLALYGGTAVGSGNGGNTLIYSGDTDVGGSSGKIEMYTYSSGTAIPVLSIRENQRTTLMSGGTSSPTPGGTVHISQLAAAGGIPCLQLEQDDADEQFIEFDGTSAADSSASLSSLHGTFPNHTNANDGWIRISVNGTDKWIPFFATPA